MEDSQPLRRIRFSTDSFLSLVVHSVMEMGNGQSSGPATGGLIGKREGDLVYVINAVSGGREGKSGGSYLKGLVRDLKEQQETRKGVEVVGWYGSSPGMDLEGPPSLRESHEKFETVFPGSFLILLDPVNMERNTRIHDYMGIYNGIEFGGPDVRDPSTLPDIEVDIDLSKIVKMIRRMAAGKEKKMDPAKKEDPVKKVDPVKNVDPEEKPEVRKKQDRSGKVPPPKKKKKKKSQPIPKDPHVELDRISRDILKLKGYLAKLKRESISKEHEDKTWLTKRIRFLKMKQLALFDDINARISVTTDIQMRIAFYKTRDSLAKDMKLLDDLISEQYMETLTDLVRMGAEKSD